jgi:hypothetical protein
MRQSVLVRVNPTRSERRRKAIDMEFEPISESLRDMLVRQGLQPKAAPTAKGRGIKELAAATMGASQQVAVTSRGDTAERERDGVRKGAGRAAGGVVTRPATAGGGAPADLGVEKAIEAAIRNGTGRIVRYVPLLIVVLEGGRK